MKWAAGKRKQLVESASWPPGDAPEAKSFMVSQCFSSLPMFDIVDGDNIGFHCIL